MKINILNLAQLTNQSALKLVKGFFRFNSSALPIFVRELDEDQFLEEIDKEELKAFLSIDHKSIIAEFQITKESLMEGKDKNVVNIPDGGTREFTVNFGTEFGRLHIFLQPDAGAAFEWGEFTAYYETGIFASN
jgi:hypothetical protein